MIHHIEAFVPFMHAEWNNIAAYIFGYIGKYAALVHNQELYDSMYAMCKKYAAWRNAYDEVVHSIVERK